jgi:hypothetical protein
MTKFFLNPGKPIGVALCKINMGIASTLKENSDWSVRILKG